MKPKVLTWLLPWKARNALIKQNKTIVALKTWIKTRHPLEIMNASDSEQK